MKFSEVEYIFKHALTQEVAYSTVPQEQRKHLHERTGQAAEACFQKAIAIAQKQHTKSLELRAVMSLAQLWQQQGNSAEAHRMLSEVYHWFTEGFDTKDLREAKALLEELRERSS